MNVGVGHSSTQNRFQLGELLSPHRAPRAAWRGREGGATCPGAQGGKEGAVAELIKHRPATVTPVASASGPLPGQGRPSRGRCGLRIPAQQVWVRLRAQGMLVLLTPAPTLGAQEAPTLSVPTGFRRSLPRPRPPPEPQ